MSEFCPSAVKFGEVYIRIGRVTSIILAQTKNFNCHWKHENAEHAMPELPEVETIRRELIPIFVGEVVVKVIARKARIFQNTTAGEFSRLLTGKKIVDIRRHGKFCIFDCQGIYSVFHLGMTGIFLKNKSHAIYPQHIHIQLFFSSGKELHFQDVRKFSKVWLYDEPPTFSDLGIDPTTRKFTLNNLKRLLNLKQMNIKFFLMDQRIIAGIGNIYANEILFEAGISPLRKSNSLSDQEISRLYSSIRSVLNKAIMKFGTTYSAYRTVAGQQGTNQNFLKVYQRSEQPCTRCGTAITKIVLGSRSTFYCPNCQE